jgi:hypothetical protein
MITINTVQGIGDLIWVYRKLGKLYDQIKFNILIIEDTDVQKRSEQFLLTLDKCAGVDFIVTSSEHYGNVAKCKCDIKNLENFDYAVNAWLEDGIHIDDIDDNPVLWDINLKTEHVDDLPEKYLLVYSSGSSRHENLYQLSNDHWAELIIETAKFKGLTDVIFIGAPYDEWKIKEVISTIGDKLSCEAKLVDIKKSSFIIQHAEYFIAYQSGLCMLSEELGTPTFMIWFPHLVGMQNTWIRKENIENNLFKHTYFDNSVELMIHMMKDHK